jgi:histidinol-phosphate aminotransferase
MTMTLEKRKPSIQARREVGCFEPYLPGRSLERVKKEYGLKSVIKLASNENPLGASPKAVAAARNATGKAHLYPDGGNTDLRAAVAAHAGVPTSQVTMGAGSDELIELLGRAFLTPQDDIVVSAHAFTRYKMAADIMGAKTITVPMRGLTHDLAAMAAAVTPRTKLVFVANPNNPTGTYNTAAEMDVLLAALPPSVLLVVDEAYYEYACEKADYADGLAFFKKGGHLMVLRTFSKARGLAGLRLGWGVGPAEVVDALERIRPPFNVNVAAQAAGVAALADGGHVRRSVRLVASEMRKMERALTAMGVSWVPSAANFLLVNVGPRKGKDVFEAMIRKGVIIRSMDEYGLAEHVRVTIGLPAENKRFLKTFKDVMGGRVQ